MKCPAGVFDSVQLDILQASFDRVCHDLGIAKTDTQNRDSVAEAIMDLARTGQDNHDQLLSFAASRVSVRGF